MNSWAANLQDSILSNSALRGGLTDDEAQPFIDWGLRLAEQVGQQMEGVAEDQAESAFEEKKDALLKLMTRIDWIAQYRESKGADWTADTLQKLNELNRTLFGEAAPQLTEAQISHYAGQEALAKGELVQHLMRDLSAPAASAAKTSNEDLSIVQQQWQAVKAVFGKDQPASNSTSTDTTSSISSQQEDSNCD